MRVHRAADATDTLIPTIGLMKIGHLLQAEYSAMETPMPERLTALLMELEVNEGSALAPTSEFKSICPRCKFAMAKVVHAPGFGGHPGLGGYACPKCRYVAGGRIRGPD
jgi:hypothetical protein